MANKPNDFTNRFNASKKITQELERGLLRLNRAEEDKAKILKRAIEERKRLAAQQLQLQREFAHVGTPTTEQTSAYAQDQSAADIAWEKQKGIVRGAQERFDDSMAGTRTAAINQARRSIHAQYRPGQIQSEISQSASSSSAFHSAFRNRESYTALEEKQQRNYNILQKQEGMIANADLETPAGRKRMKQALSAKSIVTEEMGRDQAAMNLLKQQGRDPMSLFAASETGMRKIGSYLGARGIKEEVAQGQHGTLTQEQSKLDTLAKDAMEAWSSVNKAAMSGSKGIDRLRISANKAQEAFSKQSDKLSEMGRQGAGGGKMDRFTSAMNVVGDVGRITSAVGGMQRYGQVTSELEQAQQRIGFADYQNRQVNDWIAGGMGDIAASRRSRSGIYGEAARRGADLGEKEQSARTKEAAGTALQTASGLGIIGGGLAAAKKMPGSLPMKIGAGGIAVVGGVSQMMGGVSQTHEAVTDIQKDIGKSRIALAGAEQQVQLEDSMQYVQDRTQQANLDFSSSLYESSKGISGNRGRRANVVGGIWNAARELSDLELSESDQAGLLRQGKSLGSEFRGVDDIRRAGQLEKQGRALGSEYIDARTQLSNVGGGNGAALEDILTRSFGTALDNSKNLSQMVSATTAASVNSARAGIDVTRQSASSIGLATQNLINRGVGANAATAAAASGAEVAEKAGQDRGGNLVTALESARMRSRFGKGLSLDQEMALAGMSQKQMAATSMEDVKRRGWGTFIKSKEDLQFLTRMKAVKSFEGTGGLVLNQKATEEGRADLWAGRPMNQRSAAFMENVALAQGYGQQYGSEGAVMGMQQQWTGIPEKKPGQPEQQSGRSLQGGGSTGPSAVPGSGSAGGQPNQTSGHRAGTGNGTSNHVQMSSGKTFPPMVKDINGVMSVYDSYRGTPYGENGGYNDNRSIDCSGFAQKGLVAAGLLDKSYATRTGRTDVATMHKMLKSGELKATKLGKDAEAQRGDLIMINGPRLGKTFDHVEVGYGDGKMIGSSSGKGVSIRDADYFKKQGWEVEIWRPDYASAFKKTGGTDTQIASGQDGTNRFKSTGVLEGATKKQDSSPNKQPGDNERVNRALRVAGAAGIASAATKVASGALKLAARTPAAAPVTIAAGGAGGAAGAAESKTVSKLINPNTGKPFVKAAESALEKTATGAAKETAKATTTAATKTVGSGLAAAGKLGGKLLGGAITPAIVAYQDKENIQSAVEEGDVVETLLRSLPAALAVGGGIAGGLGMGALGSVVPVAGTATGAVLGGAAGAAGGEFIGNELRNFGLKLLGDLKEGDVDKAEFDEYQRLQIGKKLGLTQRAVPGQSKKLGLTGGAVPGQSKKLGLTGGANPSAISSGPLNRGSGAKQAQSVTESNLRGADAPSSAANISGEDILNRGSRAAQSVAHTQTSLREVGESGVDESVKLMLSGSKNLVQVINGLERAAEKSAKTLKFPGDFKDNMTNLNKSIKGLAGVVRELQGKVNTSLKKNDSKQEEQP